LLDILKTVVGTEALNQLTGELLTNFIDSVEPKIKETLKNQMIQYNAKDNLPANFVSAGYTVPVKDIDVYGKLKTNPGSAEGSLLFANNPDNFDQKAYNAIQNGTSTYKNLRIDYNISTDSFTFKPVSATPKIGEWLGNFIDDTVIIDKKTFTTKVMNSIYGSITAKQGKTVEQVYQELQTAKLIEQLIDDDDSFEISQEDFDELLQKAEALINGVVYYDMGCGVIGASLPLSGMTELINQISGSTDPFFVGNKVEATIEQSTQNVQEVSAANKQTIKDGFFQRLIRIITNILAQVSTTDPQIRALLAISSAFQNNDFVQISSPKDDLKKFRVFLKCIVKDAMKMINEFIFNLIVVFLVALLAPIITKIVKEKINQYVGVIKSLIN